MSSSRIAAALTVVVALGIAACTAAPVSAPQRPTVIPGPPTTLRVLAGSELADMAPILDAAAAATGVTVKMTFMGSLDGAQTVADGHADGAYDAVWFSSDRYLTSLPEAKRRLADRTRTMGSPVILGLRASVAQRLGWDRTPPSWADVATAAAHGVFAFAMTDPAASNTGFSALVAVASALDGTGHALDQAAIERVSPALTGFFSGQQLTAGSSAWLTDTFVRRATGADPGPPIDGLVSYEASLVELNRANTLGEPLTLIYPRDGVVSADYPLTQLADISAPARDAERRLTDWLRLPEVQQMIVDRTARRPAVAGVPLPPGVPEVVELPFPDSRPTIDALLATYYDRLRRPPRTVYVLDVSGSMAGPRLAALQRALGGLTGLDASPAGRYCTLHSREEVTLLPFDQVPGRPVGFTIDPTAPQTSRDAVRAAVGALHAGGDTAVFDSLVAAYGVLDAAPDHDHYLSIVVMTDGESNRGRTLGQFQAFASAHTPPVRVFPVLFGDAADAPMQAVATATGGKVFDGRTDLGRAFCEIRGYQ